MKFALAAALLSAVAFAQSTPPACALTCLSTLVGQGTGGCTSLTDLSCLCTSAAFQQAAGQCLQSTCSADDLANAIAFSASSCSAAGYTLTTTPLEATATAAASGVCPSGSASMSMSDSMVSGSMSVVSGCMSMSMMPMPTATASA